MEAVKQEFSSTVGDVAGRDVINHHHTQGRLLTKAERIDLNKLVQRLEIEFGEPGWQTWKFLHRTIGVENIESMCLGHRDQAETILDLRLERASLMKALETKSGQNSGELAQIAKRNGELDAKLKQAQQEYLASEARSAAYAKQVDKCPGCNAAASNTRKARSMLLLTRSVAGIAISVAIVLGYLRFAQATNAKAIEARSAVCEFEGKPFSIGSIIDNQDVADLECVTENDHPPQWKTIKPASNKKTSHQKRIPVPQKKEELMHD